MKDAIACMRGAFAELAAGDAVSPRRIALASPHDALSLFMPARLEGALGAKIVSVFPGNASGETMMSPRMARCVTTAPALPPAETSRRRT